MKVTIICASTACGRIGPIVSGSPLDREYLEKMRLETDASLIGANTLRLGDPEMLGPGGVTLRNRIRAIITGSGRIPVYGKRLFLEGRGRRPIIFTGLEIAPDLRLSVGRKATVVGINKGPFGLSIADAVSALARLGVEGVLIEGGAGLNYSALYEGIVDELHLTITPKLSGEKGAPSLADGPLPLGRPFLDMKLFESRVEESGEVFLRYKIKKR
ncbi:MAG: RibD family protein [Dissulfurimicrobium sp.]|uniref:RibD family protein n=1 Tax=Dissulfurimicrobium TaxID=1769732 RepID=UPI001EDC2BBD|nr:RibD family protein [Dissulfurimicrobium hydrothermale]UKL13291.1 RibD family protein [Dissulfurimicrobium hydrothermale]